MVLLRKGFHADDESEEFIEDVPPDPGPGVSDGWLDLDGYAQAWAARGGDDPYLRPEYLHAAAAIEEGEPAAFAHGDVLYPFLVRDLGDGRCDITSAYGAGGPIGTGHGGEPFRRPAASAGW